MSVPKVELCEASLSIDVSGDTTKGFSKRDADIDAIRKDVQALKVDTAVLKWMNGMLIAMVTTIVFKLFVHLGPISVGGG